MKEYDKDFYLEILGNINVGVFVLDADGNYLFVSDTYCRMLNKTPEFYQNTSISKLKEEGYLTFSVWEEVVKKKSSVVALVTVTNKELNLISRFFTSGIPTFNSDGSIKHIFYMVESFEDITQRIQSGILNKQNYTEINLITKVSNVDIIAESPKMKQLMELLNIVSKTDASILISGPTGSGKEVLANYTHSMSIRSEEPFVSVDCASIPDNLLESELFGYEKGAFTGASTQGKLGQIEAANGGTLLLDEINSMPLELQGKLLRVLETRKVKRIGALKAKPIDFRLICASNDDLESLVHNGSFRSDLYYRINVIPINIPPLQERKEDIVPLAFLFLQHFCKKYSRIKVLTEEVINEMLLYDWPGNIRELRNFIERMVVTSSATNIEIESVSNSLFNDSTSKNPSISHIIQTKDTHHPIFNEDSFSHRSYMEKCEKQLIEDALAQFKKPTKVAEVLKLDLSNVYRKMRKYHISRV